MRFRITPTLTQIHQIHSNASNKWYKQHWRSQFRQQPPMLSHVLKYLLPKIRKDLLTASLSTHRWVYFNNRFLRERGMAFTPKMEYQVFLCIFQKNSTMATMGLKEMGKFLLKGREKGLPCWLFQFSKIKLRQPAGQTFFPTYPKEFSHFLQT